MDLFLSRRWMPKRKYVRALGSWALDSGGFTELSTRGEWSITTAHYAAEVVRFRDEIGGLVWVAPMDWMCEPFVVANTGLSVAEHQRRTIENFLDLRTRLGSIVAPVLQGWEPGDYLSHVEQYDRAGVDLRTESVVGVGSVCRRQGTRDAEQVFRSLSGLQLHGFGVKIAALARAADVLASGDSMAWSYGARRADSALPGCPHRKCNHCLRYALAWRSRVLEKIASPFQLRLGGYAA